MPIARTQVASVIGASNAVLDVARARGWRVVTIRNEFPEDAWFMNFLRRGAAVRGSVGAALDPRVHPVSDVCFAKESRDAFTNPELDAWLRGEHIDHLIALGVMAGACVRATVLGARNRGYRVTVVRDAVGAPGDASREAALEQMLRAGARVVTAAEVVSGLE